MNRQEEHRQRKGHERAEKNRAEQAYENQQEQTRTPIRPLWIFVIGAGLTLAIVLSWTMLL
jgi:hypothetical protein